MSYITITALTGRTIQCVAKITTAYHSELLERARENFRNGKIPENWKDLLYGIISGMS